MQKLLPPLFLTFIFSLLVSNSASALAESLSQQRKAELKNLLIQDCGSCHGMTMKGGLGPALTPDVLKNKPRDMVEITITYGRPGTPMPPWNTLLSKKEIKWIVDTLYAGLEHE